MYTLMQEYNIERNQNEAVWSQFCLDNVSQYILTVIIHHTDRQGFTELVTSCLGHNLHLAFLLICENKLGLLKKERVNTIIVH